MAKVELRDIQHVYRTGSQETVALEDINLTFENGSAGALLGPSGCGKTTLLGVISGLLTPTKGRVFFDGKDVTDLPTEKRNLGQIFQFPVLYESMDVFSNLAFPLRNRGVPEDEIGKRVEEVAKMLVLEKYLRTKSARLGPGEKQAVALGRAIVRKDANIILLDEPMTQIDPTQRWFLRRDLSVAQGDLGMTMVYVTHDQHEALTFAQKVVVMRNARVVQVGSPGELYKTPRSPFVGFFIGTPGMNILDCSLSGESLKFEDFSFPISKKIFSELKKHGGPFQLGIRPEEIKCSREAMEGYVRFDLAVVENMGDFKILNLDLGKTRIKSKVSIGMNASEGEKIWVGFPEENIKLYKNDALIDIDRGEKGRNQ